MNNFQQRRRSAFSLIELVVVMTSGSVVLMLAIGMIHQTMTLTKLNRQRAEQSQTLARFIDRLRQDIHNAESFTFEDAVEPTMDQQLQLTSGQSTVTYRFKSGQFTSVHTGNAGAQTHDQWRLTDEHFVQVEPATAGRRLDIRVWRKTVEQPRLEAHIGAIVGRLHLLKQLATERSKP